MKFLIDTLRDKTIEAELIDCRPDYPMFYVNGEPCQLSTARSLEAEAVKEATAIIQHGCELLHDADKLREWTGVRAWLEKWGRE